MTVEIAVICILIAYIGYLEFAYRREVQQLMDRIMAKSYHEYASVNNPSKPKEARSMSDREEYVKDCLLKGLTPEAEEA